MDISYLSTLAWFMNIPCDHVGIRILILLVKLRGHGCKHETTNIQGVIRVLLISTSAIITFILL
ncbi:Adaptin ear-binding coat-associated protein 1 NECAP-1 [Zea mays]|uniref:Adaptin ear-binding coat-associated protein 1 NECAP-1 n=1 Tax=Zea mays TaxID=4577 RepID=A0A1D6NM30_MAIZE|nr:Adaptin ear-binding coat-associated protein 1 NECAP-1 [Zea mays]